MVTMYVDRCSDLWRHTKKRVNDAEDKTRNQNGEVDQIKFAKLMVTRLQRITHEEKIHYAIRYLKDKGYDDIVEIYEGRLFMDEFVRKCSQGVF